MQQPNSQPAPPPPDKDKPQPRLRPSVAVAWTVGLLLLLMAALASQWFSDNRSEIDFTFFESQIQAHNVKSIDVRGATAYGEFVEAPLAPPSPEKTAPTAKESKSKEATIGGEGARALEREILGHSAQRKRRSRIHPPVARGGS